MKKLLFMAVGAALMLTSCNEFFGGGKALREQNDSLLVALNQKTAEFDNIMASFNDISEGFRMINAAENRVDLNRGQVMEGQDMSDQIKMDIEFITNQMEQNRNKIAELEKKLAASNNQSVQLRKAIENLNAELQEKTKAIQELQEELAQKNIRIAELDSAVQGLTKERNALVADSDNKDLTIAVQDKALNTAWFVFGTKKELKEQKILSSGGLFRKSEVLSSSDANMDYFTQVDIRKATEIKLYSKDAELLTNHPDGSYELVSDESGELTLKISNPTQFWSMSKYLVVQVK